jgi:DNA-binding MarR family transcriptional regulator
MTITKLASDMVMDRATPGRNIQPLERDGLIRTKATVADGCVKQLLLTKAGGKRLEAARKSRYEAQRQF